MKRKLCKFLLLVSLAIAGFQSVVAQESDEDCRIRIGFANFKDQTESFSNEMTLSTNNVSYHTYTHIKFNLEKFSTMLQTALVKTRRFEVIERNNLDMLLSEQGLTQAGIVDPSSGAITGHVKGVDFILIATVTKCGLTRTPKKIGKFEQIEDDIELEIDFRLTDSTTGRIALSDFVESNDKVLSATTGNVTSISSTDNYLENAMRKASLQAAFLIANAIDPVQITGIDSKRKVVRINYGNGFIEKDQIYRVFPNENDSWSAGIDEIGKVKVKTVTPTYTVADIIEGDASEFAEGQTCVKITIDEQKKYEDAEKVKTKDTFGNRFGY